MTDEMTAEEAVKILTYERDNDIFVSTEYREKIHEALTKAIQALEQQPSETILDKIRAEINTIPCAITSMREIYVNKDKVINILDKYKIESEDTE